ncbi:magnesium transporter CorA family protein [Magnetospirillum aberrantis]|uniref:Magnesium transport protein CorA n=1 Tax=Magnetospirillum aberrantis SpK TaxID=908842 RepID=A0A7C9QU71_9PROT|nr:magnesium transporter CorA family protein [Magnetospirillum aberrantis]NFV80783.1 magnesium transporter CorA family protein [Magnetospirillum aberrantis SpK]
MISVYSADGRLSRGGPEILVPDAVWIDLLSPTPEEEDAVESLVGTDVPTREEMQEIEASSRLSRHGDHLAMTVPVLTDSSGLNPQNVALTFILAGERLITVRYGTPQAVAAYLERLERPHPPVSKAGEVLLSLVEALVDRLADVLERIAAEQDAISHRIFHHPNRPRRRSSSRDLEVMLRTIGRGGDLQSKAHDTIMGLRRMVVFLPDERLGLSDGKVRIKTVGRDLQSLAEYATFLANKVAFLLDATLGMINIQQNHIIKLFSVMAVLLMPPTLVASIYGMNFRHMPELDHPWGYPAALLLMLVAALVPYWLFKRKGWL